MYFLSSSGGASSCPMIRCICNSLDTSLLISYLIIFHKLTSRIACSSVGDHGYWFCLFNILFSEAIIPLVIRSSKSFISVMSSSFSCALQSLRLSLLIRSKIWRLVVNSLRCSLYVITPVEPLVWSLHKVWSVTSWKRFSRNWCSLISRNSPRWSDGAAASYDVIPHAVINVAMFKVQKIKYILSFPLIYVSGSLI